jgi:UDP-N-acetylglucosamine 2-epimerase (non-hydrolysing)
MRKVTLVFGTRPEAIKMCPLAKELKARKDFETTVCVTSQHREMLKQVLEAFDIVPDSDLNIMRERQTIADVNIAILSGMPQVLAEAQPEIVLVHGDTSTAFATALSCFYQQVPIGHVEAGLRTGNMRSPFPEEFNRCGIGLVADLHFAPTAASRENLLKEGHAPESIFVTGNTGIDALRTTVREDYRHEELDWAQDSRLILITAHRRENLGAPMRGMFRAIRRIVEEMGDVKAVYPVHLNPAVREAAHAELDGCDRIRLIEPLGVLDFHNFMKRAYLVLTDSGGIQEEAPSLGKPVLVMRDTTERPEGVAAGTLKLVGTGEAAIYEETARLLRDKAAYSAMSEASNPYGDGFASRRIADILAAWRGR